ncbi:MAG: hypothetical protein KBD63_06260 [Bacteriovoracaceae bacterium]|nr:hypothetical protein [Bacteriovoracaceae bacterium]
MQKSVLITNERGQSFLEFVLLLLALMSISLFTMYAINGQIGTLWEYMVNLIVGPDAQVRLR